MSDHPGPDMVLHVHDTGLAETVTVRAGGDILQRQGETVHLTPDFAPGVVDTPMWDEVDALFARHENKPPGQTKREMGGGVPFGRMGRPEDMTGMAVFPASDEAEYIVTQTCNVDGGQGMN